jgi:hypothetical protein
MEKSDKNVLIPLNEVEKTLKKFVIEKCFKSDFDMLDDKDTMKIFKNWWREERQKLRSKHGK